MTIVAGIDVGGTFTDLVLFDPTAGTVRLAKTPTTPANQATGALAALDQAGVPPSQVDLIIHGTTTTTNAVLERRLARTGLITTQGFRDVLELGRRTRPNPYGMTGRFTPIIPRDLRLEVPERTDAQGRILTPLDEATTRQAIAHLLAQGCEALVIHFLHAYANPTHELRAAEIARELWPTPWITAGHQLLSESREYERGVTAAVNASVQPVLERYLARLQSELTLRGYPRDLLVVTGNGGMASARTVSREAAKTVMSGPASGVMAALATARRAGIPNLITYDMGGTSTDVALIKSGTAPVSSEIELEYAMPIHLPMVDVRTVGAGGGSIARLTPSGLLEVGPASAGADPGPIAAGRGGTLPTITDANLLLGRLDPARFPALESARRILTDTIAAPLSLTPEEAAAAILRIADTRMANAIRMVSLSLGADPRDYTLFAFGGAGPLHAAALARELGLPRVLVPARPGITNALGCATADLRFDFVRTLARPLPSLDIADVHTILATHESQGRALIAAEPVPTTSITTTHAADMQFVGQTHLLRVPLPSPTPTLADLHTLFEQAYRARFHVELPEIRPALVNLATSVTGHRPPLDLRLLLDPTQRRPTLAQAQTTTRPAWFGAWHDTPVYRRDHLPPDATLTGPAILEQMDSTTLLPPGDRLAQDADGNLLIEISPPGPGRKPAPSTPPLTSS
ncbi:MAG TPA: hydantoinase/oxoprolinase family protein [Amaricoccus sp.]|nr:hydantoinase/oxoprolinase family protein [Amaricoccus sp.]HRO12523.1 hydantoinase/oxoprolinase family protein [Amaricoccus sp.]